MEYEWDEAKRRSNLAKHGIDFADVANFDWETAVVRPDVRHPYGEVRLRAEGFIGGALLVLIFTHRGSRVRIISLRKASRKEKQDYEETP